MLHPDGTQATIPLFGQVISEMSIRVRRFRTRSGEALGPLAPLGPGSIAANAAENAMMQAQLPLDGAAPAAVLQMGRAPAEERDERIAAVRPVSPDWRSA